MLGELGIVQSTLATEGLIAGAGGVVLFAVGRRRLHSLMHTAASSRRQHAFSALQALPMLEGLSKGQLFSLVDVMERQELPAGAPVSAAFMHVLISGSVLLGDRGALHCGTGAAGEGGGAQAGPGDCYGEAACLVNGADWAQLGARCRTSTPVELLSCERDTFSRVLGSPEALLPSLARKRAWSELAPKIEEEPEEEMAEEEEEEQPARGGVAIPMAIPRSSPAAAAELEPQYVESPRRSLVGRGRLGAVSALSASMRAPVSSSLPSELRTGASSAAMPGSAPPSKGQWRLQLSLSDFLLGARLGEGLTGRVHYARLKLRSAECALKVMRKARLIELGEEHHVRSELEALDRINSPFVTALLGCFQDSRALYIALEYMRGPDLFAYMCAGCVARPALCAHSSPPGTRSTRPAALSAACPPTL